MPAIFTFPNRILFGEGARRGAARPSWPALGVARPLVVTDPGLVASGLVDRGRRPARRRRVVFDGVQANPTEADVLAGLDRYRERGCDGVIGLGGGSPIDAAKAIRLLATHPGRLADYDLTTGGLERITARPAADGRHPDHRRDRQRGRPRGPDPAPADRPQDDRPEPAPAAERRRSATPS